MWYLNVPVTSSSKTRSHLDIQVRNNVVLGVYIYIYTYIYIHIYIYIHVVRINRWLNYETVGLHQKYTGIWQTHPVT